MRTICAAILVAGIAACVVSAAAKQSDAARMGAEMMNPGAGLACLERKCDGQFRVLVYYKEDKTRRGTDPHCIALNGEVGNGNS